MSQTPPEGRGSPRWSDDAQVAALPASIAGLVAASARVSVTPPLSARSPSSGSATSTFVQVAPEGQPLRTMLSSIVGEAAVTSTLAVLEPQMIMLRKVG